MKKLHVLMFFQRKKGVVPLDQDIDGNLLFFYDYYDDFNAF